MIQRNTGARIVSRTPSSTHTAGGDYLRDEYGNTWQECDRSGFTYGTGDQNAVILWNGKIVGHARKP